MRRTAWRFAAIASLGFAAIAATRPHYGGTLRTETQSRAASLDPAEFGTQENMTALVFDRLVSWSDTAQPQPALASGWRHDAGFKFWEFQLRPGVKFQDGSPLTAHAAAAALGRLGAVAVGDTLIFRSAEPAPGLLATLAGAAQSISKRSADGAPIGTGPFRLQAFEPGKRATFAANDDYWGGRPYLDTIEIEMGRSLRDQALDFELNKADVIEMTPGDVRRAQQSGRKVWTSAPVDLIALVFDAAVDERMRRAVAMSIDRAAIQSVLLQRQGAPTGALLPQWLTGYSFLFADLRDLRITPRASAPITLTYDPRDAILHAIGERIAVNAREANVTVRPVASAQNAAAKLVRIHISTPDAREALSSISAALGVVQPKATTPYGVERAILQDDHIVPLFHLSQIYGLSQRVRNWSATRWGALRLESVWLAQEKSRP